MFEDTKGVFGNRKSKTDRQHNAQKKKDKRTNNDLQSIHKIDYGGMVFSIQYLLMVSMYNLKRSS
jgi:hypothetical protein